MSREDLDQLDEMLASIHTKDDVFSYEIDKQRQIEFPRGFLREMDDYRGYFPFINEKVLKTRIASHMMHRDTLDWFWLKTDIWGVARHMIVKFQLINLAAILEGVLKHLKPTMPKKRDNVYHRIDDLAEEGFISNPDELKELWASRNSIHLHLTGEVEKVRFSNENYIHWHSALGKMIEDLNRNFKLD